MSIADLEKFIGLAAQSDELQAKIAAAPQVDDFVRLAAKHGCEFNAAEAKQLVAAMTGGELSEGDLAGVAGGIGTWPTPERPALRANFELLSRRMGGFSW